MKVIATQEPKTSWWSQKGAAFFLISCTPSFSSFIQFGVEQIVQRMRLTDLFTEMVYEKVFMMIQRNNITSRVEVQDLQIMTKCGSKKKVSCWISSTRSHENQFSDQSSAKIVELALFELTPNPLSDVLATAEMKSVLLDEEKESEQMDTSVEIYEPGVLSRMSVRSLLN